MTNISAIIHQERSCSLTQNPDRKKVLPNPPMVSYKKPTNLREMLTRSQLPPIQKCRDLRKRVGFKQFNMTRCETYPYTVNTTTHTSKFTNTTYHVKEDLSCYTENTIKSLTLWCVYIEVCQTTQKPFHNQ